MREIKFRAWNPNTKEFDSSFQLLLEQDSSNGFGAEKIIGVDDCIFEERLIEDGAVIQQYTGLKDRNGREIYEGDIIAYSLKGLDLSVHEVRYKWGGFGIEGFLKGSQIYFANLLREEIEVVGNIYENPELLEVGDEL